MNHKESDQRAGRVAIIQAAERLFAMYGLHGASLRQISEASGQKNASAIQYHFGSRDGLVEAVFSQRMSAINPRRQAALDALTTENGLNNVRDLVSVMVVPMADELRPRAEGNHYLQFLNRATQEKVLAIELAPPELLTAWNETIEHLRRALRYLPEPILRTRINLAPKLCISSLAAFEAAETADSDNLQLKIETLIDMIATGLTAPVSERAMQAIEAQMADCS